MIRGRRSRLIPVIPMKEPSYPAHAGRVAPTRRRVVTGEDAARSHRFITGRHTPRKRSIQYAVASRFHHWRLGILDRPPEAVIGGAEGETRWRAMTVGRGNRCPTSLRAQRSNP